MLVLADEAATGRLAARVASLARRGDVIALGGPLGVGKTSFARAFIRASGAADAEVPSPTFTLVEVYERPGAPIWHFDLFRLDAPADVFELGIEEAFADGISLVEWPERLGPLLPRERLGVELFFADTPQSRRATVTAPPAWSERLGALDHV